MIYEFTKINRIKTPHNYMYFPYQGSIFLDIYLQDRIKNFKNIQEDINNYDQNDLSLYLRASENLKTFIQKNPSEKFNEFLKRIIVWEDTIKLENVNSNINNLSCFNLSNPINTKRLLISLLDSQLNKEGEELIKFWMDLLVQRFEVTKKLYESYQVNFRKGKGRCDIYSVYWFFAISLAISYSSSGNIKYLSTILKVMDLLYSLDQKLLTRDIPSQGLLIVLLVELISIQSLSRDIKGVNFDLT